MHCNFANIGKTYQKKNFENTLEKSTSNHLLNTQLLKDPLKQSNKIIKKIHSLQNYKPTYNTNYLYPHSIDTSLINEKFSLNLPFYNLSTKTNLYNYYQ